MGYQLETTALNFQENYNAFRIRCIMLILEILYNYFPTHIDELNGKDFM